MGPELSVQTNKNKGILEKGRVPEEVEGVGELAVVLVAVGGRFVAVDAAGGLQVGLHEQFNCTRNPAACRTGWALVFGRGFRQNAASIAARSFDAVCYRRSPVLS